MLTFGPRRPAGIRYEMELLILSDRFSACTVSIPSAPIDGFHSWWHRQARVVDSVDGLKQRFSMSALLPCYFSY